MFPYFRLEALVGPTPSSSPISTLYMDWSSLAFLVKALSIKAGLTRSYISKIERGAARCGLEVFFLIAQALEVDPAELISDLPPGTESAQK